MAEFNDVTYAAAVDDAVKQANDYTDQMLNVGQHVGDVTNGSSFPTTRKDGSPLHNDDYVKAAASSTFPFSIGTVTFDNRFSTAIYLNGNWYGKPGTLQDTAETPVKNPTLEGVSGTANTQAEINIENKAEFAKKLNKATETVSLEHAYIHKADGTDALMQIDSNANAANAIVRRDNDKQINVPLVPVGNDDATSKAYVDAFGKTISTDSTTKKLQLSDSNSTVISSVPSTEISDITKEDTVTLKNKTIDADDNTISNITGANFKQQSSTEAGKTHVIQPDGSWALGKAGNDVDNVTIGINASEKLEVKDEAIDLLKFAKHTSDTGKVYSIKTDGTTELTNVKQYKRISTFTGEIGNTYTEYYLDTPSVIGTVSYGVGLYIWSLANGYTKVADIGGGGGGGTSPILVGIVSPGGFMPTIRPDGNALVIGDYVKPYSGATFPFTVSGVTFNDPGDTAVYMTGGNWLVNAAVYQATNQIPIYNKAAESINGASSTAVYQADINTENVAAIKEKIPQYSTMPTAAVALNGKIVQYIGTTTTTAPIYKHGFFYECGADTEHGGYKWSAVLVQEGGDGFVPQLKTFPALSETSPDSFQYIGDEAGYDRFELYKKDVVAYSITCTYGVFYSMVEPPETGQIALYNDPDCTVLNPTYKASSNGIQVIVHNTTTSETTIGSLSGGSSYAKVYSGLVTETGTQTLDNKTIDADSNTISNLEVDNFNANAVSTSIPDTGASDAKVTTEKAVKDGLDKKQNKVYYSDTEPATAVEGDIWVNKGIGSDLNTYTKTECDGKFAEKATTLAGYGITDAYTQSETYAKTQTYSKTECDDKFVIKGGNTPTLTARSGWVLWGNCVQIGGSKYFLNITVRNDTGSVQGSSDLCVADMSGNPFDCALAAACYESINAGFGGPEAVLQTKVIKLRCLPNSIPIGGYIPISGVIDWFD